MRRVLLLLIPLAVVVGCSDGESVSTGGTTTSDRAEDQRYEADATVLESAEHGPQLCLGDIADSYPPQCGGPDLIGWDWAAVDGEETAVGTTWGSYHVVGTYTTGTFTLTEPASTPSGERPDDELDFSSPCPEPAGGWAVVEPATATQAAQDQAGVYAAGQPDYAGLWVDQSINPALADGSDPGDEQLANDPTKLVLNVRFTGDLDRHEAELRTIWGGALCVSIAEHSEAELSAIQAELGAQEGMLWSSTDTVGNHVELGVIVDGGLQEQLDARYGEGVVVVTPALRPVD